METFSLNKLPLTQYLFFTGKGGVGKTTVAAAIALGLAKRGRNVHLTTTDPAARLKFVLSEQDGITMSHIDEAAELKKYQEEVLSKARRNGLSGEDLAYIEEDLRSPCTQEIAVFRAFAEVVEKADDESNSERKRMSEGMTQTSAFSFIDMLSSAGRKGRGGFLAQAACRRSFALSFVPFAARQMKSAKYFIIWKTNYAKSCAAKS